VNRLRPALLLSLLIATATHAQNAAHALWLAPDPVPAAADIPALPDVRHEVIHRAAAGHYQFLLGAALIFEGDTLWASWGNSLVDENDEGSVLAGRASKDGGSTWGRHTIIAPGAPGPDSHSHGVFLNHGGEIWAFAARADYVAGGEAYPDLRTEAFLLTDGVWKSYGIVMESLFWPLTEPQRMADGKYIMGGAVVDEAWPNARAAVALSEGDNLLRWTPVIIPAPEDIGDMWGETALIVEPDRITAIVRYGARPIALTAASTDFGRTWTTLKESNLPNANSKPYAGLLSTGQWYAVVNIDSRDTLAIFAGEPGERGFSKVWTIRTGPSHEPRWPGRGKHPQWSYPYAIEHNGTLYVAYAISKEDCGLSVLPVAALSGE
jgi:hypothetical protein